MRNFNEMTYKNGEKYTHKAMRRSGLALDNKGQWTVEILNTKLQEIIRKFPDNFNGILE